MAMAATMAVRAFLSLFLLVTLASTARAITCYECDSVNNPGCGENFASDDIATTDCEAMVDMRGPETEPTCLTKYLEGVAGEALFVRRSCFYGDSSPAVMNCDESPDPMAPYLNFLGCKVCNADLCNGAAGRIPLSIFTALSAFAILVLLAN
ncbi:hypothetical protein KR009_003262 [Drosophila setifemur]|nr:hypothetical protein KR009_003262 [Drosophila setifemur]